MTCRKRSELLGEHVARELGAAVRVSFEAHLALCPECAADLRSYVDTIRLVKHAAAVPDDLPEELVRAILALRTPPAGPVP